MNENMDVQNDKSAHKQGILVIFPPSIFSPIWIPTQ